jgi:NADH-quinone oxidoreductase subunit F
LTLLWRASVATSKLRNLSFISLIFFVVFVVFVRGTPKFVKLVVLELFSLDSFFNRPGIYEVDMGTPLKTVIEDLGQGFKSTIKAMHIGGPLGGLVPISKINELNITFESFQENGFLLGHASVVCIPQAFPLVNYLHHLFEFTAHESCGKCFPCRLGSTRGKELFDKAINTDYKIDKTLLTDLLETMEIGSLCALGGGLPLPIKNALMYFEEELREFIQ